MLSSCGTCFFGVQSEMGTKKQAGELTIALSLCCVVIAFSIHLVYLWYNKRTWDTGVSDSLRTRERAHRAGALHAETLSLIQAPHGFLSTTGSLGAYPGIGRLTPNSQIPTKILNSSETLTLEKSFILHP